MSDSLKIVFFFALGLFCALAGWAPEIESEIKPSLAALWILMALVGLSIGANKDLGRIIRSARPAVLLLPLATTVGTFFGAAIAWLLLPLSLADCLATGAGFAYYSLSSVFVAQSRGPEMGAIVLVSNLLRELFTLLFAPLIVRYCGPMAAISCGGASTMDTTLPAIARSAGSQWVFPAIIHAMVLDFSVPFWLTLFYSL